MMYVIRIQSDLLHKKKKIILRLLSDHVILDRAFHRDSTFYINIAFFLINRFFLENFKKQYYLTNIFLIF